MKLRDRLERAILHAGLTQTQIEDRVKKLEGGERFTQQTLSKLVKGNSKTSGYLVHIAIACGVNPGWLAAGYGEMTNGADPRNAEDDKLDEDQRTLLALYERLPKELRAAVFTIIEGLAAQPQKKQPIPAAPKPKNATKIRSEKSA